MRVPQNDANFGIGTLDCFNRREDAMDMMDKKFWTATLAAFVTSVVLSFVAHGVILASEYETLQGVYRPHGFEAWRFLLLLFAQLIMAGAMAALYRFGVENRPYLGQGVRFG